MNIRAIGIFMLSAAFLTTAECRDRIRPEPVSRSSGPVGNGVNANGTVSMNGSKNMYFQAKKQQDVGIFNFETKTVLLNSGYAMPITGL